MNNWQHLFTNTADLTEHLKKPYLRYDNRSKDISSLSFDEHANLLWSGDTYGCVSSYDPNFQLYTRHRGHIGANSVNDIVPFREGILSLSEDSIHMSNRRGVTMFNLTSINIAEFSGLQTMCPLSIDNQNLIYCAGNNTSVGITCLDLNKAKLANIINYNSKVKLLKSANKLLAIGKQSGVVDLLDPRSNQIVRSLPCHSDTITSMDIRDFTMVTTGKSKRFYNSYSDPFVNIFDLRAMKQLSPISFSKGTTMGTGGADFVQLHPVLPTVMLVGSSLGSFDFIDLSNPTLRTQYVHPGQEIKNMKLSPSGDHIAVLEKDNLVSTWSRSQHGGNFTNTPQILQYPDYVDDGPILKPISVDDYDFPLSSVGMPYYTEKLLSAWPYTVFKSEGTIPKRIETTLPLSSTKQSPSNKQTVITNTLDLSSKTFPFYRYDKAKYGRRNVAQKYICLKDLRKKNNADVNSKDILTYKNDNESIIPPAFKQLPFTYGKYGSDSFDFKIYNKTNYSGLDTDVENSYTNAIIQLYRFVPEVHNFVVGCLKDENFDKPSLLSEMGYLFDMMSRSKGKVCRSANFQTALNSIKKAKELGIIGYEVNKSFDIEHDATTGDNVGKSVIQKFNEFLLDKLLREEFESTGHNITLEQCLGFTVSSEIKAKCNHYNKETNIVPSLTILSPTRNGSKQSNKKLNNQTILPYLESSMKRIKLSNNVCETCGKEDLIECESTVNNLPPLLSFEVMLSDFEWKTVKSVKNWLAKEFYATIYKSKAIIKPNLNELKTNGEIFKYELNGYVARITDPSSGTFRHVTYSRIYDNKNNRFRWYMFNSYLVVEVDEEEALNVSHWWKSIEVLLYCDAEELRKPFFSVDTYPINYQILYRDHFSNTIREGYKCEYKMLTKEESPKAGTLIAIDAEFVLLNNELSEIDCQGNKNIIRPKKPSLARLSVIRGDNGPLYGIPFIDDYIYNKEHIEDYLTKYSGILPGDLNLQNSKKALVSREVVYRKVWLLMQLGCIFVGHGLSNDFKLININVPKEQIRDTAVYFLQGKRFLSLRYLAFALLDKNIQEDNHDSIEDAYTALILYKKYLDLKDSGTLPRVIDTLYEEGRSSNYKVPENLNK